MIELLLAIVCSSLISVVMRWSERYHCGDTSMLSMNYLMCCLLGVYFAGGTQIFPADPGLPRALALGAVGGVLFLGAFLLLRYNINKNGVVLPSTFMKLGILIPTVLSITVFGDMPRWTQIAGLILSVAAILVLQDRDEGGKKSLLALIALLLVGGLADAMSKIYEQLGPQSLSDQFLLYVFGIAFILCVALCLIRRQRYRLPDVLFGLAIGIPNYFSTRFLLASLRMVPAMVAYPTFSVGTIILVTVAGVALFREKISRRKLAAMGIILAALVLLNV